MEPRIFQAVSFFILFKNFDLIHFDTLEIKLLLQQPSPGIVSISMLLVGWLVGPSQSIILHNLTIFTFCTRFWCSSLLKIFFSLLSSCPRRKYVARYDIFYFELQLITFCLEVQYLCFRKWIYWSLFVQRYNQFIISLGLSDMLNAVLMLTSHQVC